MGDAIESTLTVFKIFFLIEISSDCFQYPFLNLFKIPGSLITDSLPLRLQFSAQVALGNAPPPRHVSAPAGKGHFGASVSDDVEFATVCADLLDVALELFDQRVFMDNDRA